MGVLDTIEKYGPQQVMLFCALLIVWDEFVDSNEELSVFDAIKVAFITVLVTHVVRD